MGLLFVWNQANAQQFKEHPEELDPRNKGKAILFHVNFGGQIPAGDMADRFGINGAYGAGLEFMTEGNFALGLEGEALFGQTVKEDPLSILRTPEGDIIGNDRTYASVVLRERGLYMGAFIGKLINIKEYRNGIRLTLGGGWLQHHIRVQDDNSTLTQITGDYAKGYDRLTGGFALNQFIGWQHLGKMRRANWMIGFEFNQGFTNTLRDWDFSEMKKLDAKRLDLRFGIRATWTLPYYWGRSSEIFY